MAGRAYTICVVLAVHAAWGAAEQKAPDCSEGDGECLATLMEESTRLNVQLMQKRVEQHRQRKDKEAISHDDASEDGGAVAGFSELSSEEKKVNRAEVQTETASLSSFRSYLEEHMNFENQSMMEAFVTEHASTWRQLESNSSLEARGIRSLLSMSRAGSQRSVCALKYTNKYFLPKLNLCANSFTGLTGCTEGGCYALSAVFYSSYCYTAYYSNAESKESGYGMCRCLNNYNYNLYDSGAGNNIYSCSSVLQ